MKTRSQYTHTTIAEVRAAFWDAHPEIAHERRSRKRQNDYRADIRMAWCDYVEYLSGSQAIPEALAQRATL